MKIVVINYVFFALFLCSYALPFGPGSPQWTQVTGTWSNVLNTAHDLQRQPSMHSVSELGSNLQSLYNQLLAGSVDMSKLHSITSAMSIIQEASISGSLDIKAAQALSNSLEHLGVDLLSLDSGLFHDAQFLTEFRLETGVVSDLFKDVGEAASSSRVGNSATRETLSQLGLNKPLSTLQEGIAKLELNPTDVDQWSNVLLTSEKLTSTLKSAVKAPGLLKKPEQITGQTALGGGFDLLPLSKIMGLAKGVGIEAGIDFGFSASGKSAIDMAIDKLLGDLDFLNHFGFANIDAGFLKSINFSKELNFELSKSLLLSLDGLIGKDLLGNINLPSFGDGIHAVVDHLPNPFEIFEMIPHLGKENILAHIVNAAQCLHTLELDAGNYQHWAAALEATEKLIQMTKDIAVR